MTKNARRDANAELTKEQPEWFDRSLNQVQQLNESWANRLRFEKLSLRERYLKGELRLLLRLIWERMGIRRDYVAILEGRPLRPRDKDGLFTKLAHGLLPTRLVNPIRPTSRNLDDLDLPDGYACHPELDVAGYKRWAEVRVEALNQSIRGLPEELVRLHICWGSIHHPHTQDIPLKEIIDLVYKVKAHCYSIEAANPQHEHEWEVFKDHPLPDGKILMPGIIGHAAREFVEHPEVVSQRTLRYANLVGRENVIIGTDCGLQRTAHPSITWAKFRAAQAGAAIATKQLSG